MPSPTSSAPRVSFAEKVSGMMQRTGKTRHQVLQMLGGSGGRTAARNKRRRRAEMERQEAMKLVCPCTCSPILPLPTASNHTSCAKRG